MNKAASFFIKRNAFLAAQKLLALDEKTELTDELLTLGWEALYDLAGFARPTEKWTPGAWAHFQAVNR